MLSPGILGTALVVCLFQAKASHAFVPVKTNLLSLGGGWIQDAPVTALAAGMYRSVALREDGTIAIWGDSDYGTTEVDPNLTDVVAITPGLALRRDGTIYTITNPTSRYNDLDSVVAIATGGMHGLALRSNGRIVAWGNNDYHQTDVPSSLRNVRAIAAGTDHSLALLEDGTVVAWGSNSSKQSTVPSGLTGVKAIAAGRFESIALKEDGTVVVWGACLSTTSQVRTFDSIVAISVNHDKFFLLRNNGVLYKWYPGTIDSIVGDFTAITAGGFHALAIRRDGSVLSWPTSTVESSVVPRFDDSVVQIAPSYEFTAALQRNGRLVIWGSKGTMTKSSYLRDMLDTLSGIRAIAAGKDQFLTLQDNGRVQGWAGGTDYFTNAVPRRLDSLVATRIFAGTKMSLATMADGSVVSWGVLTTTPALSNVRDIAAGGGHVLALLPDSTVVAWGDSAKKQTSVPPGLKGVVAIAAGELHSLALRSDGTVVAWGDSSQKQTSIPPDLTQVVDIAAGAYHSVALRSNGTVVAWGRSREGQTRIPNGLLATAIHAGGNQTWIEKSPESPSSIDFKRPPAQSANFTPGEVNVYGTDGALLWKGRIERLEDVRSKAGNHRILLVRETGSGRISRVVKIDRR